MSTHDYPWMLECWREMMAKYKAGRPSCQSEIPQQISVALDEAATYHRLAMDKADEADRLREALRPFASMQSDNEVDCCAGYPDEVIIRIEASVGEIRRARAALNYKELIA
jgi:hypothetical protein